MSRFFWLVPVLFVLNFSFNCSKPDVTENPSKETLGDSGVVDTTPEAPKDTAERVADRPTEAPKDATERVADRSSEVPKDTTERVVDQPSEVPKDATERVADQPSEVPPPEPMAESDGAMSPESDGGSPRDVVPDSPAIGKLIINEVAPGGSPATWTSSEDWVELYNGTNQTIDLSTYTISDTLSDPTKRTNFPAGTTIAAGEYKVIELTDAWPGFKLGSDEEVGIYDAQGNLVDSADWPSGAAPQNKTYGRMPNLTGTFQTLNTPTPGKANVPN